MIIGIDGQPIQGIRSGAGWYLTRLLEAFSDLLEEDKVYIWMNQPQSGERGRVRENRFLEVVETRFPLTALRMTWNTLGTPTLETLLGRVPGAVLHVGLPVVPQKHGAKVIVLNNVSFLGDAALETAGPPDSGVREAVKAIAGADAVVTCSEYNNAQLIQAVPGLDPARVHVVPQGLSAPFQKPAPAPSVTAVRERYGLAKPYFLFVGTLEQRKNLLRLVHAFLLYKQTQRSDHQLVLAGAQGWIGEDFMAFVGSPAIAANVRWLKAVPEEDLPALYTGADVFLFPPLKEGFGLPVLEAMGCGTPVLASNGGALPEVAGEAAYLLDPTNVTSWAEVMGKIVNEPSLAEELRARGNRQARQFRWEKSARSILEAVRSAAAGRDA